MNTFKVHIYEADSVFFEGDCESLVIPTTLGELGILAHHENIVCAIDNGTVMYRQPGGQNQYASITKGIFIMENNEVTILATALEHPEEIDEERARQDILEAEEQLKMEKSQVEYYSARAMMARNANRLKTKSKYGSR